MRRPCCAARHCGQRPRRDHRDVHGDEAPPSLHPFPGAAARRPVHLRGFHDQLPITATVGSAARARDGCGYGAASKHVKHVFAKPGVRGWTRWCSAFWRFGPGIAPG